MASDALGTMVVGVTANVDPAQQAITNLAKTLDDFLRNMERGSAQPRVFKDLNQHVLDHKKHLKEIADLEEERLRPLEKINKALADQARMQSARGLPIIGGRAFAPGEREAESKGEFADAQAIRKAYEEQLDLRVAAGKRAAAEEKLILQEQESQLLKSSVIKARIRMAEIRQLEQMAVDSRKLNAQMAQDIKEREDAEVKALQQRQARIIANGRLLHIETAEQLAADRRRIQSMTTAELNFRAIRDSERADAYANQLADKTRAELRIRDIRASEQAAIDARNEVQRRADVATASEAKRRFKEIQQSERAAVSARGIEDHMAALALAQKSGSGAGWDANLGRSTGIAARQLNDVTTTANRARYAIINLGYGVQDAATVFGTSGFAGALRASANNMSSMAVMMGGSKMTMEALKGAVFSVEFGVIALATGLMIGADAWEKYQQKLQKAAEEMAKARFARFDVGEAGQIAAGQKQLEIDLRNQKEADAVKAMLVKNRDDDAVAAEKEMAQAGVAAAIRAEKERIAGVIAERDKAIAKMERQQRMFDPRGGGAGFERMNPADRMTQDDYKLLNMDERQLRADLAEATKKLNEAENEINDTIGRRIELLRGVDKIAVDLKAKREKENEEWKIDELNRQKDLWAEKERADMQEKESGLEYRVQFLARRRGELTAASRRGMETTGVAAFQSSAAYEALAKSRMQPAGDTELLQKLVKAQETATKELAAIREKLDPGRGARIAILEKIE